jgi:hypothetical protein
MAFLTRQENFIEQFSIALGFLSLLTPPNDPLVGFGVFSLNTVKMDLTLSWTTVLEESPLLWLGIAAEIWWICLQYLTEALLVLHTYCEAVHLGIDVLQELISGMNLFANFIIYPYLIPHDISERGLISVEIMPITTLLAVIEWETRFVLPSIEALIGMKTIVGITNKLDVLLDR